MRTKHFISESRKIQTPIELLVHLSIILLFLTLPKLSEAQYCEVVSSELILGSDRSENLECDDWESYLPDDYTPELIVKLNFHFIHDTDLNNPKNFMPDWDGFDHNNPMNGYIFSNEIFNRLNTWANEYTRLQIWPNLIL